MEMDKMQERAVKTELEHRKTISDMDNYKSEVTTLNMEIERFAGRMAKYQDNEDRIEQENMRYKMEAEAQREQLDKATREVDMLRAAKDKQSHEIQRLHQGANSVENIWPEFWLEKQPEIPCILNLVRV